MLNNENQSRFEPYPANRIAVVMGTYNRGELLDRSLWHYEQQGIPHTLIIFDDGSTDDTKGVVDYYTVDNSLNIHYVKLEKEPGKWRDSACYLNAGIAYALHVLKSQYVFITHPEIIPGRNLLRIATRKLDTVGYARINAKGYYLTPGQQENIENVDLSDGIAAIRTMPNFYEDSEAFNGNKDYTANAVDRALSWGSWIWGGFTAYNWRRFGGVFESETWGAVDVEFLERCRRLNVQTVTPLELEAMVIHQNHDIPGIPITPRNNDWMETLRGVELRARPELISKERWESLNYMPNF